MKTFTVLASSLLLATGGMAGPASALTAPNGSTSAIQKDPVDPTQGDEYCDSVGHCCPEWLVDSGGFCLDGPI
jgi:hypothetical protein